MAEGSNTTEYHMRRCGRDDCTESVQTFRRKARAAAGEQGHRRRLGLGAVAASERHGHAAHAAGGSDAASAAADGRGVRAPPPPPTSATGPPFQFYDVAAFFEEGGVVPLRRGRDDRKALGHTQTGTVRVWPPYMGPTAAQGGRGSGGVVPCESVGTAYLVPASVYRCVGCPDGLRFDHFATALTEHFPIVHAAKHYFGLRVVAALDVIVQARRLSRVVEFLASVARARLATGGRAWRVRKRACAFSRTVGVQVRFRAIAGTSPRWHTWSGRAPRLR